MTTEAPLPTASVDEFAHVPSPRRRVPWLSVFVIAFAAFLVYHQRADMSFALSSSTPRSVGDARALAGNVAAAPVNRYVQLTGRPDFESALLFDTQGSWVFTPFFRLMGGQGLVFVQREPDPLPSARAASDVYTGRLLRIRDLPYDAAIRGYFATHVTATHVFDPRAVHAAVRAGDASTLTDRAGDAVRLRATDRLTLEVDRPGELRVGIPRERFPKLEQARDAVAATGAELLADAPATAGSAPDPTRHLLRVRVAPDKRQAVLSALADLHPRTQLRPAREAVTANLSALAADEQGFTVKSLSGDAIELPLASVASVRTVGTVELSPDALLLVEGERPRDHLRSVFIAGFLVAFALVNLLALRRAA